MKTDCGQATEGLEHQGEGCGFCLSGCGESLEVVGHVISRVIEIRL